MKLEKIIKTYTSIFDDNVTLIEVVRTTDNFVVRILGEADIVFANEQMALHYAQDKFGDF